MMDLSGPACLDCGAWHDGDRCGHDRNQPCRYCTRPVGGLSSFGPDVCAKCEVVGVPPDIYMGLRAPYDFHDEPMTPAQRER